MLYETFWNVINIEAMKLDDHDYIGKKKFEVDLKMYIKAQNIWQVCIQYVCISQRPQKYLNSQLSIILTSFNIHRYSLTFIINVRWLFMLYILLFYYIYVSSKYLVTYIYNPRLASTLVNVIMTIIWRYSGSKVLNFICHIQYIYTWKFSMISIRIL